MRGFEGRFEAGIYMLLLSVADHTAEVLFLTRFNRQAFIYAHDRAFAAYG
jgi:hypothetical protein